MYILQLLCDDYWRLMTELLSLMAVMFYCNIFVYVESGTGCMHVYVDGALVFVHAGCD